MQMGRQNSMGGSENDKAPTAPSLIDASDTPKNPIKPADSPSKTAPEIPKVGTKDAPGG
jgi:hypothetical protein